MLTGVLHFALLEYLAKSKNGFSIIAMRCRYSRFSKSPIRKTAVFQSELELPEVVFFCPIKLMLVQLDHRQIVQTAGDDAAIPQFCRNGKSMII